MQTYFVRLVKTEPSVDQETRAFLGRAYNLKAIADYETGPGATVTVAQAMDAIAAASHFAAAIARLIPATPSPPPNAAS